MLWKRNSNKEHRKLVFAFNEDRYTAVSAKRGINNKWDIEQIIHKKKDEVSDKAFIKHIQELSGTRAPASWMLTAPQYELITIDEPGNVDKAEMEKAIEYKLVEVTKIPLADIHYEHIKLGKNTDDNHNILAVVTSAKRLRSLIKRQIPLNIKYDAIIDIEELCLRNLLNSVVSDPLASGRAYAGIFLVDERTAVFLVCAEKELYFYKRFAAGELSRMVPESDALSSKMDAPATMQPAEKIDFLNNGTEDGRLDYFQIEATAANNETSNKQKEAEMLVEEIRKYFDMWEYNWSILPIEECMVGGWDHNELLVDWLTPQVTFPVKAINLSSRFNGLQKATGVPAYAFLPLLGLLERD